jgi:large subunit ribosomal protein L4
VATLKKYDLAGKEIGKVTIEDELLQTTANSQLIKDYIVAIRANARQWSANTQTRPEVNHSNKKPHPQKGTGRARQGTLTAPHYKGGAVAWGPRPKFDQHVRINRKERRLAIMAMLSEKIKANQVQVLHVASLDAPKTKKIATFMKGAGVDRKRTLFLGKGSEGHDAHFLKSMRNIPRTKFLLAPNVNGYELALCHNIVVLDSALESLLAILGKRGQK